MGATRTWMRTCIVVATAVTACHFSASHNDRDGSIQPPDGGACAGPSKECATTDILRSCDRPGVPYVDQTCAWGCVSETGAHCGVFVPAGNAAEATDLLGATDKTIMTNNTAVTIIDVSVTPPKIGGVAWTDFRSTDTVMVLRFRNLVITTPVLLVGTKPIVLAASQAITIDALINGQQSSCAPPTAGPGGFAGGAANPGATAVGSGGGAGGAQDNTRGGGGGGNGAVGGGGGSTTLSGPAGGSAWSDPAIKILAGGGGGGGGGAGSSPVGGGGGAAIQLVAAESITIGVSGAINAGGCGGKNGGANDAGAGGGAGGTILIESRQVTIDGKLAVNGGGGGAGGGGSSGTSGLLDRIVAVGGPGSTVSGGDGGWAGMVDGLDGLVGGTGTNERASGGGGAAGRIRINTKSGTATIGTAASLSPGFEDALTTCTQGALHLQ